MVTGANNGKAERTNGYIQEIKTIGRGYGTAERYRIAILFFYGDLDISMLFIYTNYGRTLIITYCYPVKLSNSKYSIAVLYNFR